jgi:hypothetical protein
MKKHCTLNIYVRRWPVGYTASRIKQTPTDDATARLFRAAKSFLGFLLDHLDGGTCLLGLVDEKGTERIFAKGPKRLKNKMLTKCLNLLSATVPVRAEIMEWKSETEPSYDDSISLPITKDQYQRALIYATRPNRRYHLLFGNCANFATNVGVYANIHEIPRFFLNAPFVMTYWIWRLERTDMHNNSALQAETLLTRRRKQEFR